MVSGSEGQMFRKVGAPEFRKEGGREKRRKGIKGEKDCDKAKTRNRRRLWKRLERK